MISCTFHVLLVNIDICFVLFVVTARTSLSSTLYFPLCSSILPVSENLLVMSSIFIYQFLAL
jgi:hypothetical protein